MSKAHRRSDHSNEIGVFDATRYFSDRGIHGGHGLQRPVREESGATRYPQQSKKIENQSKDKKSKQPSSPGGKLASFLRSFFKQSICKKKSKSLTTTTQPEEDAKVFVELKHSGRRSTSRIFSYSRSMKRNDSNIMCCSNNKLPAKVSNCSKSSVRQKYSPVCSQREDWCDKMIIEEDWVVERAKSIDGTYVEFMRRGEKWFRREEEDWGGSDASSDLFELKNYELGW